MWAEWTRIWWFRPVSGVAATSAVAGVLFQDFVVRLGGPGVEGVGAAGQRGRDGAVGTRPIGNLIDPLRSSRWPSTRAR